MKKTLLAAALLAGFAGAAQAQSSVTLYGILDTGFNYKKVGDDKTYGIDSGLSAQSRWGIRGTEDLGNGLKALFVLESAINVDNGNNALGGLFRRHSYVGLSSSKAGQVIFGRTTNFQFGWAIPVANPFGLGYDSASLRQTFAYNEDALGGGRADNSVYYTSPVFAGLQFGLGYSFNIAATEQPGSNNNSRLIDTGLKYSNGPINAALTYLQLDPAGGGDKLKSWALAANYNFGVATVYAGYNNTKGVIHGANGWNGLLLGTGGNGATNANFTKDDAWTLGVSAPVGAAKVFAAYQKAEKSKVKGWALGASYDLSKRTSFYTFYGDTKGYHFVDDESVKVRQFALGLKHNF